MKPLPFLIPSLLCLALFSCKSIEKIPLDNVPVLLEMEKGQGMGRFPVYNLRVYDNQIVAYLGKRNTPKLGTYIRKLSDNEWKQLQQQIESTNIWQYPEFFRSRIPDLPLVKITQFDGDVKKTISGKEGRPAAIMSLEASLETIANQPNGWVLKEAMDFGLAKDEIPNQLQIELQSKTYAYNWVTKYYKQNMQILGALPEKSNYWLVSYDPTVTFPKEMQQLLEYDPDVVKFSFNKEKTK